MNNNAYKDQGPTDNQSRKVIKWSTQTLIVIEWYIKNIL